MATDDERRLVAERMRMSDERDAAGFDCLLAEVVRGREFCETPCEYCHGRLLDELADLIDPCDTSHFRRDTVACESGHESGQNLDIVPSESPAVQMGLKCDREALLALARWAKDNAWYFALDHDKDELRDRLTEASEYFSEVAECIYEACGEVVA